MTETLFTENKNRQDENDGGLIPRPLERFVVHFLNCVFNKVFNVLSVFIEFLY
jgi:hypothetical protein